MLTSIPIISPIEVKFGEPAVRLLASPPDYEVDALPTAVASAPEYSGDPAQLALEEIEHAAEISEYHDFSWWEERIRTIRSKLEADPAENS